MNVVGLYGGLGNQMYQYAFGKALATYGSEVRYALSWFKDNIEETERPYRLDKFKTDVEFATFGGRRTIPERKFPELKKIDGYNFKGYWQYPRYYESVLPHLKDEFCVREEFYTDEFLRLRDIIRNCDSVSVHIRRGDYVTKNSCYALPFSYYIQALHLLRGRLFFFSDDIEWCKIMFNPEYFKEEVIFVQNDDYLDFELMKNCKASIIANSTFSLWTAMISEDKPVVYPSIWRVKAGEKEPSGLNVKFPNHWIKL